MTPDIREKAERLFVALDVDVFSLATKFPTAEAFVAAGADLISQALLEARKAGREEERERCAEIAEHYEVYLAAADMRNPEFTVAKLAAIRSIK